MGLGCYMAIAASLLWVGNAVVAYRLKSVVRAYADSEKENHYNEERRAQRRSTQSNKSRPIEKTKNKNDGADDPLYHTNSESPVKAKKSSGTKKKKKKDVPEQIMEEP
jgi:Mg-chelatase subunit ChlI